jgi:hypothetical protein
VCLRVARGGRGYFTCWRIVALILQVQREIVEVRCTRVFSEMLAFTLVFLRKFHPVLSFSEAQDMVTLQSMYPIANGNRRCSERR